MHRSSKSQRHILPPHLWRLRPIQLVAIDLGDWLFPWVVINLLWCVLSLTVILLPPASAALFSLAEGAYRNEPPTPRQFLTAVRGWLLQSWVWTMGNAALFIALFLIARTVYPSEIPLALVGVAAALLVLLQFFFWPYMALEARPRLFNALRNSVFTALAALPYLVVLLAVTLFVLIPSVIVIAPLLLITPVFLALLSTYSLIVWLERHNLLHRDSRHI